MWPIMLLLNFTQLEIFDWPSKEQWLLILVNGLCGTVISELLWLWLVDEKKDGILTIF